MKYTKQRNVIVPMN